MRDYKLEYEKRVAFIKEVLDNASLNAIVYGNSGGKDSTLVGILCKAACEDTVGVILPCSSSRNFGQDRDDAEAVGKQFGIETRLVDLTAVREAVIASLKGATTLKEAAAVNIAPRLRMTALYAIAASERRLVAGTGNRSEAYMGYYTKWGDGAYDFNPIADLTVTEIYEFLNYLNAPSSVINKPPSAGLFEGQTDEGEMGVSYGTIDKYLLTGEAAADDLKLIDRCHCAGEHKSCGPICYSDK